jgi:molecular chaperone GrpE
MSTTESNQETASPENKQPETNEVTSEQGLLDQLRNDLDRFKDLALRSAADLENYRKRAAREKADAVKFANASFLDRLVPILDNFELGLAAAKNDKAAAAIVAGLDMVSRQLADFLLASGVEAVKGDPGTRFDPNVHEAIGQEESAEIPEGSIVRQLRKGFKLSDRLLRPATVVVSKGAPAA